MHESATLPKLHGGALCLDLANTLDPRGATLDEPVDFLSTTAALVAWTRHVGLVGEAGRRRLARAARDHPAEASAALRRTHELREAIYRVFAAIAEGAGPRPADLDVIQGQFAAGVAAGRLERREEGFAVILDERSLELAARAAARSAVELLLGGRLDRIHRCPGVVPGACDWLFLDETRSGTRRWCSMASCGSRAKMRRHYRRHHERAG